MKSAEFRGFQPKSPEELEAQLNQAQGILGEHTEHSLVPSSEDENSILNLSLQEIKSKYARRYEMYLNLIRNQRAIEEGGVPDLSQEEVVNMRKWLKGLNGLDAYIQAHKTEEEQVLRERQLTVFEDLRNFVEAGGTEGYIKLPTGVGKTVLFTEFTEALDLKTLVVVPTNILVNQTERKFTQFAPDLDVGKVAKQAKEFGRQVTIITYDSLVRQLESGELKPEEYDCLILDEVHLSLSKKRSEAVQKFNTSLKIGFTATPDYSYTKKVSNLLETEIHQMSIREAVEEEKLLSPFSALVARTQVDLSSVPISGGDYSEKELEKAVNLVSRNQAAVDLYKKNFEGQLAVTYCVGIEHAKAVAELFNKQGIPAAAISGESKNQEELLEQFNRGEIKVLCNADILIAGFDEPQASVCLNLRPTKSYVVAEQRGGRVLRLDENNPQKHAHIIDFLDQGITKDHPILFADVAEGVHFEPKEKYEGREGGSGGERPLILDIPGIEVITNVEEIMRIVAKYKEKKDKEKKFLPFDQLVREVRAAGIKSQSEYDSQYKQHPGWPSEPNQTYKHVWKNWADFLGKEQKEFISYAELQTQVRAAGIKGFDDYTNRYKNYPGWPSKPHQTYKDVWPGWEEFLGKGFLPFEELKKQVRAAGIRSKRDYFAVYKDHPGWPGNPHTYQGYKNEWQGWDELVLKFLSFEELRKQVIAAGIVDSADYAKEYKKHPDWPSVPARTYKDKWPKGSWAEFTGKKEVKKPPLPYDEVRKQVLKSRIKGVIDYKQQYKRFPGWPSDPDYTYRDVWPGWPVFLGKK